MKTNRPPREFTDITGRAMLGIQLAGGGGEAEIEPLVFARLVADGLPPNWQINYSKPGFFYVRAFHPNRGKKVSVARFVVGAGEREAVHYRDGNVRNLRTENIEIWSGYARMDCSPEGCAAAATAGDQT